MTWTSFWLFIIFSPISMLTSLFVILIYKNERHFRKQPGDILLGIAVSTFFLSFSELIGSLFSDLGLFGYYNKYESYTRVVIVQTK